MYAYYDNMIRENFVSAYLLFIKVHKAETTLCDLRKSDDLKKKLSLQLSLIVKIFMLIMNKRILHRFLLRKFYVWIKKVGDKFLLIYEII